MARRLSERYDVFGQDTYTHPDEEPHAADMGQPSTAPREHHADAAVDTVLWRQRQVAHQREAEARLREEQFAKTHYPAVLCQTPVLCSGCGRHTRPFEDVLVLVDGDWYHDECAQS